MTKTNNNEIFILISKPKLFIIIDNYLPWLNPKSFENKNPLKWGCVYSHAVNSMITEIKIFNTVSYCNDLRVS